MEMYERIRLLRKKHKLSQEAFGERLGVSRSVIKNIELDALARPEQKLSLIKLICKEFSVSEDWLLNGNGEMEVQAETFSLDEFAKQHSATDLELNILKAYFELDPDLREQLIQHFKERLSAARRVTKEEAEEQYIKKISNSAQSMGSSASNITEGTDQNAKEA